MTRGFFPRWRAGWLALVLLNALALSGFAQSNQGGTATQPVPREQEFWTKMHQAFLDRAAKGDIDLLFLGDSITQGWNNNEVWQRFYGSRKAANFGIGGDRTQHVLWRLDHGEAEGFQPKVVVLMIGTNNIGTNSAEEIAAGVHAIVDKLREKFPKTKVLLLGIFPRGAHRDQKEIQVDEIDPRTGQVNAIIQKLDDDETVEYLDIGSAFLDEKGRLPRSVMPDLLHLSIPGYRAWAEAIEPTLWKMLDEKK